MISLSRHERRHDRKRARNLRAAVSAALFMLAGGLACAQTLVKVGVAVPLTGSAAAYGKDILDGVQMAVDEANAAHPVIGVQPARFVIDAQDDQADPRVGVQVAQRLVDDKVAFVIGHFNSGTTLPASAIYARADIPMITPDASSPAITQQGLHNVYRVIANDTQNASSAAAYARDTVKARRIAILDDRTAFGQGQADEFAKAVKARGGLVVAREFTSDKAVDFNAQLTAIKNARPDLLFFSGLDAQAAMVLRRMRQLGIDASFLAGGGVKDENFIRLAGNAGSAGKGAAVCEYGYPLDTLPNGKTFANRFRAKFGTAILAYAPFAYDATQVAIDATLAANSTAPSNINAAIRKTDHAGITGRIAFLPPGDLKNAKSTVYQVKNMAWVPLTGKAGN